jgi:hypothetical protein
MFDIHTSNMRALQVSYSKDDGSPGEVEGAPQWTFDLDDIATLEVDPDGMNARIKHNGSIGLVTLSVTADGDLGAGVHPIVLTEQFNMLAPLGATQVQMSVGDETPIT